MSWFDRLMATSGVDSQPDYGYQAAERDAEAAQEAANDNAWNYISAGDISGLSDYTDRNYNIRDLPLIGHPLRSLLDAGLSTWGDILTFAGDPLGIGSSMLNKANQEETAMGPTVSPELSFGYITDPNGLSRLVGSVAGSALSLGAPVGGLARTGLMRLAGEKALSTGAKLATRRGLLGNAGKLLQATSGYIPGALSTVATTPLEAMAEGGQAMRDALDEGASLEEAQRRGREVFRDNLGVLSLTNAVEGGVTGKMLNRLGGSLSKLRGKSGAKAGASTFGIGAIPELAVGTAINGYEEGAQQGIQDRAKGMNSSILDPRYWDDEQREAALEGAVGAGGLSLLTGATGAGLNRLGRYFNDNIANGKTAAETEATNDEIVSNVENAAATAAANSAAAASAQGRAVQAPNLQPQSVDMGSDDNGGNGGGASIVDDAAPFMGKRMDNGENGCVEAVTKIGAAHNNFLANEKGNGVVNVDTLVQDAQNANVPVIPFDASQVQAGDVIVYGDNDHVVTADGQGGYVGNSSSQQKVVHGSDYTEMGGLKPTKIIKTGSSYGSSGNTQSSGLTKSSGNEQYDQWISEASSKYGVPANLLSSLLNVESGYNPNAHNDSGATGIAQFMSSTAQDLGIDPSDPRQSIDGAARYLKQNYDQFGNWEQALEAYNGGPGNVGSGDTKEYAQKVLDGAGDISRSATPNNSQSKEDTGLKLPKIQTPKVQALDFSAIMQNAGKGSKQVRDFFKQFAEDTYNSLGDVNDIQTLEPMFRRGKFHNTEDNRLELARLYQKRLQDYYDKHWLPQMQQVQQQNETTTQATANTTATDAQPQKIETSTPNLTTAAISQGTQETNAPITPVKSHPEEKKTPVQQTQPTPTVQDVFSKTQLKSKSPEAVAQGKMIRQVAQQVNVPLSNALVRMLGEGQTKAIHAAQSQLAANYRDIEEMLAWQKKKEAFDARNQELTDMATQSMTKPGINDMGTTAPRQQEESIPTVQPKPAPKAPTVSTVTVSPQELAPTNETPIGNVRTRQKQSINNEVEDVDAFAEAPANAKTARGKKQGLALTNLAKDNNVELKPSLVRMLKEGQPKAIRRAQNKLSQTMAHQEVEAGVQKRAAQVAEEKKQQAAKKSKLEKVRTLANAYADVAENHGIPSNAVRDEIANGDIDKVTRATGYLKRRIKNTDKSFDFAGFEDSVNNGEYTPKGENNNESEQRENQGTSAQSNRTENQDAETVSRESEPHEAKNDEKVTHEETHEETHENNARAFSEENKRTEANISKPKGKPVSKDSYAYKLAWQRRYGESLTHATTKDLATRFKIEETLKSNDLDEVTKIVKGLEIESQRMAKPVDLPSVKKYTTEFVDMLNKNGELSEQPETKKAADNGDKANVQLADGYKTESGRPLSEADKDEFIIKPDGSRNFGGITPEISKATGGELKPGPIRLKVGNDKQGLIHAKKHEEQAKADGYTSIEDMIDDVTSHFDEIYVCTPRDEYGKATYSLVKRGNKVIGKMNGGSPVYFELQNNSKNGYYIVLTAIPKGDKTLKRATKKSRLIYSSSRLGAATQSNAGAVSHGGQNVGTVTHEGNTTSDKSSSSSISILPQKQENGERKTPKLPKLQPKIGVGKSATVTTDSGKEIHTRYVVLPVKKVITSNQPETMAVNKKYPQELQPRDRQRVSMQDQVNQMAGNLRPEDLTESRNLNQGAPIVRDDGIVLNGNGRALAIKTAFKRKKGGAYRDYILNHGEEYGLSKEDIARLKSANGSMMLVREVTDNLSDDDVTDIINSTTGGSRMGAAEQAKADAEKIRFADLSSYVPNEKGNLTTAQNRDFVAGIINRITTDNERNMYYDEKGNVNADGIQRVKRALFAKAYGDDELLSKMAESTDDSTRNITNGLTNAAPLIARVNQKMQDGTAQKYPLAKTISDAVTRYDMIKSSSQFADIDEYLDQQGIFNEYKDTDEARDMLRAFDDYRRSGKKVSQFVRNIGEMVEQEGNPQEISLIGNQQPRSLGDIIQRAKDEVDNGGKGTELFAAQETAQPKENPADNVASYKDKVDKIVADVEAGKRTPSSVRNDLVKVMTDANTARWNKTLSNDEAQDVQKYANDALGKMQELAKDKRNARKKKSAPKKQEKPAATSNKKNKDNERHADWGNEDDVMADMEKMFGVKRKTSVPQKISNEVKSVSNKFFDSLAKDDDNLDNLLDEFHHEASKLSMNPIMNPKVWSLLFRIGAVYVRRGFRKFANWADKIREVVADDIKPEDVNPWLSSVWKAIQSMPKDKALDAGKFTTCVRFVGIQYEHGNHTLDAVKKVADNSFGEDFYRDNKAYINTAFDAVNAYYHPETVLADLEGETNANDGTNEVASRTGERSNQDAVGTDDESTGPVNDNGQSVQQTGTGVREQRDTRLHAGGTTSGGEAGNRGVQAEESENNTSSTRGPELSRSVRDSLEGHGTDGAEREGDKTSNTAVKDGRDNATAEKVNRAKPKAGSLEDSVQKSLPVLFPEQQDDVVFAERRLKEKGGQGVMFTNGTGTGKTFTGMGVVKRFWDAGKKNILIVAPNQEIVKQWADAAHTVFEDKKDKNGNWTHNIEPHILESTKDAGKGLTITTYANFGANDSLVNRDWDLIVSDESQKLMDNEKGTQTNALKQLRALTYHHEGLDQRYKLLHPKEYNAAHKKDRKPEDYTKYDLARKAQTEKWQKIEAKDKPRVVFLSATPFSWVPDVDYAEGYLFDYDYKAAKQRVGRYNQPSARGDFFIKHFGYRMRTGKLTRPDGKVDNRTMEVEFNKWLKKIGVVSGRSLKINKDYDRGWILTPNAIGQKIDAGLDELRKDEEKYPEYASAVQNGMDNRYKNYLLEYLKAKEAVPIIKEYIKQGKKVVVFHQSVKGQNIRNPFDIKEHLVLIPSDLNEGQIKAFKSDYPAGTVFITDEDMEQKIKGQQAKFQKAHPELFTKSMTGLKSPIDTLQKAFGDELVQFNGKIPDKKRNANKDAFNDDNSNVKVILCQQDAANAGISLHDVTGKHQRVLINLAIPRRPTYAMQIEGRIYRVGVQTNAIFRYLTTGTNLEKGLFASTVASRASTAENLAMGDKARGLVDSFREGYMETMDGSWKRRLPGAEGEGTGGKALDYAIDNNVSDFDRAKSFYYSRQKRTSRNKAAEGIDYFATPEPVGEKMVEWLDAKPGDKMLEPSAGHGAISRWFSEDTQNTIIEPSSELGPEAQMVTPDANYINDRFENHNIVNKYDGIAMNPPFGTGGKTAVEHIAKAYKHLSDGGRMIAILPEGPAADKRFNKWFDGAKDDKGKWKVKPPKGAILVRDIKLPAVTFERAGTKVRTHMVVVEKHEADYDAAKNYFNGRGESKVRDLSGMKDINELFDNIENMSMPERYRGNGARNVTNNTTSTAESPETSNNTPTATGESKLFDTTSFEHTKKKGTFIPAVVIKENIPNATYPKVRKMANDAGGYWSKFAKRFLFPKEKGGEAGRDKFVQAVRDNQQAIFGRVIDDEPTLSNAQSTLSDEQSTPDYSAEANTGERVQRTMDDVVAEIKQSVPNAKSVKQDGTRVTITMPNNTTVQFDVVDTVELSDKDATRVRKENAIPASMRVRVNGSVYTINGNGFVQLARDGRIGTAAHELVHIAQDLYLTKREKDALHKGYEAQAKREGRDVDEVIADAGRDLAQHKVRFTNFNKLFRKIWDGIDVLRDILHNSLNANRDLRKARSILRQIDSGEVFERTPNTTERTDWRYSADEKKDEQTGLTIKQKEAPKGFLHKLTQAAGAKLLGLSDEQIAEIRRMNGKGEAYTQSYDVSRNNSRVFIQQPRDSKDIGTIEKWFLSPSRLAKKYPRFGVLYNMADKAMTLLVHNREHYNKMITDAEKLAKSKEDKEMLANLLFKGDEDGREYTKEELQKEGASKNVIKAYHKIRQMAKSLYKLVDEAHRRPEYHTKQLNELDYERVKQMQAAGMATILRDEDGGQDKNGHQLHNVQWKQVHTWDKTYYGANKDMLNRFKNDNATVVLNAKQRKDGLYDVRVRESIPPLTNRKGYIPHFFFEHMIRVVDKDGNYVRDELGRVKTLGSGRTQKEALNIADDAVAHPEKYGLKKGENVVIEDKAFDFARLGMDSHQTAAIMGERDYYAAMRKLAKDTRQTPEEARKTMQEMGLKHTNKHRFYGNTLHRKGVSGYTKNLDYVLRHWANSAVRYHAMETEFKPKAINWYERAYGSWSQIPRTSEADMAHDYISDINGNPTYAEKWLTDKLKHCAPFRYFIIPRYGERAALTFANNLSNITSHLCLGFGNISSALLNLTQVINSAAYIGNWTDIGRCLARGAHRHFGYATVRGTKIRYNETRVLDETGVLDDIGLDSGAGYDKNRLSNAGKWSMILFKTSESTIRIGTVLAAYEEGRRRGMTDEKAIEFAKDVNKKSNFDYSAADAANLFRRFGPLGQLVLQFKKYGFKELEVMADMLSSRTNLKQKAIFWSLYFLSAGLMGLVPGEDWLDEKLFDGKLKLSIERTIGNWANGSWLGKKIGKIALFGGGSIINADVSSRAGISDIVPTRLDASTLLGAGFGKIAQLAVDTPKMLLDTNTANGLEVLRDVSPGMYNIAAALNGETYGKRGRVNTVYDSLGDRALRWMGFRSIDERLDSDIPRIIQMDKTELSHRQQEAIDRYIDDPSSENKSKLKELGVTDKRVQTEKEKKGKTRLERAMDGIRKEDKKNHRYDALAQFAQ